MSNVTAITLSNRGKSTALVHQPRRDLAVLTPIQRRQLLMCEKM